MQTDLSILRSIAQALSIGSIPPQCDIRAVKQAIAEIEELRAFKTNAAISEIQTLRDKLRVNNAK